MKQFIQHQGKINEDQKITNAQTSQVISNIQATLNQITASISQEKVEFLTQPQQNSRGVCEILEVRNEQ